MPKKWQHGAVITMLSDMLDQATTFTGMTLVDRVNIVGPTFNTGTDRWNVMTDDEREDLDAAVDNLYAMCAQIDKACKQRYKAQQP